MKYFLPVILILISCTSGNSIRSKTAEICRSVSIPREAIVDPREVIRSKAENFVPARAYNSLVDHAEKLMVCGRSLSCVIEWTEYERDCEKSKSFIDRSLGLSCDLEKPVCRVSF